MAEQKKGITARQTEADGQGGEGGRGGGEAPHSGNYQPAGETTTTRRDAHLVKGKQQHPPDDDDNDDALSTAASVLLAVAVLLQFLAGWGVFESHQRLTCLDVRRRDRETGEERRGE